MQHVNMEAFFLRSWTFFFAHTQVEYPKVYVPLIHDQASCIFIHGYVYTKAAHLSIIVKFNIKQSALDPAGDMSFHIDRLPYYKPENNEYTNRRLLSRTSPQLATSDPFWLDLHYVFSAWFFHLSFVNELQSALLMTHFKIKNKNYIFGIVNAARKQHFEFKTLTQYHKVFIFSHSLFC